VIHRAVGGPDPLEDVQVLVGTGIALIMVEPVAIALLVRVAAAADHVERQPAAAELVECRQLPRRQRRCDHPGTIGQQDAHPLRRRRDEGGDHRALGAIGEVAHQHPIEARGLVSLGETADELRIHRLPQRLIHLGAGRRRDHADDFYAHVARSCVGYANRQHKIAFFL